MPEAAYGKSTRWLTDSKKFGAITEDIRIHLEKNNIESRHVWKPMHLQPLFRNKCRICGGSVSEDLFAKGLCLPSGMQMTEEEISRVVISILEQYKRE